MTDQKNQAGAEIVESEGSQAIVQAQNQLSAQVDTFAKFTDESLKIIDKVSAMADRGSGNILLGMGAVLVIAAIFLILLPTVSVEPIEYVALIVLAGALMIAGVLARLYVYRDMSVSSREIRQFNWRIIEKSVELSSEMLAQYMSQLSEIRRGVVTEQAKVTSGAVDQAKQQSDHKG